MIIRREDVENNIPVFPDNGIVPASDSDERPRHPMGKDPEYPTLSFIDTDHGIIKYQICDIKDDSSGIRLCPDSDSDYNTDRHRKFDINVSHPDNDKISSGILIRKYDTVGVRLCEDYLANPDPDEEWDRFRKIIGFDRDMIPLV